MSKCIVDHVRPFLLFGVALCIILNIYICILSGKAFNFLNDWITIITSSRMCIAKWMTLGPLLSNICDHDNDCSNVIIYNWVSEWLLFNAKSEFFQLYHGENKLFSMKWWWCSLCTRQTRLVGYFIILRYPRTSTVVAVIILYRGTF